jgi:hypothetical protein
MSKTIVLISCVSRKRNDRARARDLYVSHLFKLNLKYAQQLADPDRIFILSAKHGLLSLDEEIDPYDETLNTMPAIKVREWANCVIEQISEKCTIDETNFIFLAGEKYRRYLLTHLENAVNVQIPLKGLRIGQQLQRLNELIK